MTKFVVGQKVVGNASACGGITEGETYTVVRVEPKEPGDSDDKVWLKGYGHGDYSFYWAYRFNAAEEIASQASSTSTAPTREVTFTIGNKITLTIDLSTAMGVKLAQAVLDTIAKETL